jgi:hypothetical protein
MRSVTSFWQMTIAKEQAADGFAHSNLRFQRTPPSARR